MTLDFSLASPATSANPLAAYSQGQEMQQRSFDRAAKRQLAADRQDIMKDLLSENRTDTASVTGPLEQAERIEKTVPKLIAVGDFQTATTLTNSAKELRLNASEASKETQRKQLAKFEVSAKAAQASLAMPDDPVLQSEAINEYLRAGGNAQIAQRASVGDPKDRANAMREISFAAMDSTKRLTEDNRIAQQIEERQRRQAKDEVDAAEKLRHHRETEAAKGGAGGKHSELTLNQQNVHSERLNSDLARTAKPYVDDLHHIQLFKQLLKDGSPVAMQQLRQDLPAALGKFSARATNLYYKDNKNFGDIVNRLSDATSHLVAGQFSEETKKQLYEMFDNAEQEVISPALLSMETEQKTKAKKLGVPEDTIKLIERTSAMQPKAAVPAGVSPAAGAETKTIGTTTYVKRDGKWYSQ